MWLQLLAAAQERRPPKLSHFLTFLLMEAYLWNLLEAVPEAHPMFGPVTIGLVRAPRLGVGRKNATSWRSIIKAICKPNKYNRPLHRNECWMTRSSRITISMTDPLTKKTVVARRILICRLLAFLREPTDAHYAALSSGDMCGTLGPFLPARPSHRPCSRGSSLCVNGLDHGEFSNREVNESRKLCKNGAACLCPGHGPHGRKCIFTHPDGSAKTCRNDCSCVPHCSCEPRCF